MKRPAIRRVEPELLTFLAVSLLPFQAYGVPAFSQITPSDQSSSTGVDAPDSMSKFLDKLNAEKKQAAPPPPPAPSATPNAPAAAAPGVAPAGAPTASPAPTAAPENPDGASPAASSPAASDTISAENLKRLNNLESQYFFQQYPHDSTEVRLSRLEKFVFGEVSKGGLEDRLTTLEQSLAVRDPSTGKPMLVQPVPKPADLNGAIPPVVTTPIPSPPKLLYPDAIDPVPSPSANSGTDSGNSNDQNVSTTVSPTAPKTGDTPDTTPALHVTKTHFASNTPPDVLIHQLNVAIQDSSSPGNLFFSRSKAYIQISKWDAALSDLSNAINDIPNNFEFYLARAYVQHQLGNGVLANEDLKRAKFYNPKLPKKIDFEDPGIAASK